MTVFVCYTGSSCDVDNRKYGGMLKSIQQKFATTLKVPVYHHRTIARGALNFFLGRGVRPGFPKCGACELNIASEKGVLWTRIFKFGGLRAEILAKIEAV